MHFLHVRSRCGSSFPCISACAEFLGQQFLCTSHKFLSILRALSPCGSSFYVSLLVQSPWGSSFYFFCVRGAMHLCVSLGQQLLLGGLQRWAIAAAWGTAALGHFLLAPLGQQLPYICSCAGFLEAAASMLFSVLPVIRGSTLYRLSRMSALLRIFCLMFGCGWSPCTCMCHVYAFVIAFGRGGRNSCIGNLFGLSWESLLCGNVFPCAWK